MTLGEDIRATATEADALTAELTAANTALRAAQTQHSTDQALITSLQANVADLERRLADCEDGPPPPPPPTAIRLGCNSTHAADFMAKLGIGRGKGVTRVFATTQPWSDARFNAARDAAARGDLVLVSVKASGSWGAEPNSTSERTRIIGIATGLAGLGVPVELALNHEPENDGGVMADYITMQKWFIALVNPILHPAKGKSAIVLINADNTAWLGDARPDVFATDTYMWRGAQQSKPWANPSIPAKLDLYLKHLDYCLAKGFEAQLWEYGCARTQADTSGTERAQNIRLLTTHPRVKEYTAISYFELAAGESGAIINWPIRDEPPSRSAFMAAAS